MDSRKKWMVAGIASLALTACSVALLWTVRVSTPNKPLAALALAVDGTGNSYTGGSSRENLMDEYSGELHAVLVKHDAAGNLLWQQNTPLANHVLQVVPLTDAVLAVVTGSPAIQSITATNPQPAALWLVSATSGEFLQQIATFTDRVPVEISAANGRVYAASSRYLENGECDFYGCSGLRNAQLDAYDFDGNLLASSSYGSSNILDIHATADGALYVLLSADSNPLRKLDADLAPLWQARPDNAFSCTERQLFVGTDNLYVDCRDGVVEVSASGVVGKGTSFQSLASKRGDDPDIYEIWAGRSAGAVDAAGNLYMALGRHVFYDADTSYTRAIGRFILYMPSVLGSDVVTLKVDRSSGALVWHDDINTPLYAGPDYFTAYYYYPLGVHLSGNNVKVSFRSYAGQYTGYAGGNDCFGGGYGGLFNFCERAATVSAYAKIQTYSAASGARGNDSRFEIPFPRAVAATADGSILMAGDNNTDVISRNEEWQYLGGFQPDFQATATSDIYLQKSKP